MKSRTKTGVIIFANKNVPSNWDGEKKISLILKDRLNLNMLKI